MMGKHGSGLHKLAFLLVIIGGLNWLLLGLIQWEVGDLFGGEAAIISRIIYIVVGLAAIYELATHKGNCKHCAGMKEQASSGSAPHPGGPVGS